MTGAQRFDLLTLSEVADLLHCSKAHVGRVVAGRVAGCQPIPALHLGRRTLVRRETLMSWIERNESDATIPSLPVRGAGRRA
jgi:excisionase family DNA binding protein